MFVSRSCLARSLAAAVVACLCLFPRIASAQDTAPHRLAVSPDAVPQTLLAPVNEATLRAEDAETRSQIVPQRVGVTQRLDLTPATGGTWSPSTSGRSTWRLRIQSDGARGVSLRFQPFAPPEGAELRVYDQNGVLRFGPYTRADATGGLLVTPRVTGETAIVELQGTEAMSDRPGESSGIRLLSATHHYRSLDASPAAKSGSCNVDVSCPEADPYRDLVRSVARISFQSEGDTFVCTGSLVNNTNLDGRPFFLTAEHCIPDPATASTVVFYWNFENSTCRPPGSTASGSSSDDDLQEETSTGAVLRARYGNVHQTGSISGKPDLTLLEVDDPTGLDTFNLYYAGWDVSGTTPASGVSIHHPRGDAKRIAIDTDPLTRTLYGGSTVDANGTHWRIGDWDVGTTERGSSGSLVADENNRLVGVLSGGIAGCVGSVDNDEPDWYGVLTAGFDQNDYVSSESGTFREWLDPAGTGTDVLDGDDLVNLPVELLSFEAKDTSGGLVVRWSTSSETDNAGFRLSLARGDDGFTDIGRFIPGSGIRADVTSYRETLTGLEPGHYQLRLRQIDTDGTEAVIASSAAQVQVDGEVFIRPMQPHPVTRSSTMEMTVSESQHVHVTLFDVLGRRVGQLHDGVVRGHAPLALQVDGSGLAAGTYLLRITGERFTRTQRIVVAR